MSTDSGIFKALADHTRRDILKALKDGELTAGQIASRFPISAPSMSRHFAVLRSAGLIAERREANRIYYRLDEDCLAGAVGSFLSSICPVDVVRRRRDTRRKAT
jgi:DNA-binding transcriptional ArsR family regulator